MEWNLNDALGYYKSIGAPNDQQALISLLREIQANSSGSLTRSDLTLIAEFYQIKEAILLALIRRIPSLRLSDTHILELCAGPNCGKCVALAAYAEKLQKECGYTLKYTGCMRMCGKGPNIRWDGKLYHGATEALLRELLKK